jgi:hypothetical protein
MKAQEILWKTRARSMIMQGHTQLLHQKVALQARLRLWKLAESWAKKDSDEMEERRMLRKSNSYQVGIFQRNVKKLSAMERRIEEAILLAESVHVHSCTQIGLITSVTGSDSSSYPASMAYSDLEANLSDLYMRVDKDI